MPDLVCPRCGTPRAAADSAAGGDSRLCAACQVGDLTTNDQSAANAPLGATVAPAEATSRPSDRGHAPPGYEILRELGRGGMGVVYEARQVLLGRVVALKMMLSGAHASDQEMQRFRTEAEAIARAQHPGIVGVYEVGEHDGRLFLSMEFCGGGSLEKKLRGTPMPPAEAAALVRSLAEAMQAAHEAKVIHRDLKPANVLLSRSTGVPPVASSATGGTPVLREEPKITDFGLAKKLDEQGQTQTGAIMGTPSYMAPEQAAGSKDVGPLADVYSLGAILYECLTGRPPFRAATMLETLAQVIDEEPVPVRRLNAAVPRDLEVICLKCLRKEPEKRYASAAELADDLRRYQNGEPIRARAVGKVELIIKWGKRHPTWAALAGVLLLVVLGATAGAIQYQRRLEQNRARLLVDSLRTATPAELLRVRSDLLALRRHTEPAVRELLARGRADGDARAELNAALVLTQWEPGEVDFVLERLLTASPEDLAACRELLQPRADLVRERLGPVVADRSAPRARRLRAQALVAEEGGAVPAEFADDLVGQMLVEDRLLLSGWVRAMRPVRQSLIDALVRRYAQANDDEAGIGAALILREYLRGSTGRIPSLLDKGGVRQAFVVGEALRDAPEDADRVLALWNRPESERLASQRREVAFQIDYNEADDADARRRLRLGLALLAAGRAEPVWLACAWSDNPRLRTNLIHAFAEVRLPPEALRDALAADRDASIRQAVYLAWGDYAPDLWGSTEFEEVVRQVIGDYETHPDPGVHSAAEWLLRQWKLSDRLKPVQSRLPGEKGRGDRRWFVGPWGMTFAVIPGPSEVRMGTNCWSPLIHSDPVHGPEHFHPRVIDRTYAIATREVTIQQALAFDRECAKYMGRHRVGKNWAAREDDCPTGNLNWYEAATFCRWLSEKEGVPEEQQCYPPLDQIKPGMKLPADYLRRTGYRLPTEGEWENACRAGASTTFCYGSDLRYLPRYAWFDRNAEMRTHPVGSLRPNRFGLFDVHGNAFEWCGVRADPHPTEDTLNPWPEGPDAHACNPDDVCVLRGGDFPMGPSRQRSAHRTVVRRVQSWPASGLRVARTLASPLTIPRITNNGNRSRLEVLGPPGRFRVNEVMGDVLVAQLEGAIPGPIDVYPLDHTRPCPYSLVVRRMDSGEPVRISDLFIAPRWNVRWYGWTPHPNHPGMPPSEEAWAKAVGGKPLFEEVRGPLRFAWDKHPVAAVPEAHCGMIATSEVELPAGAYQFEAVSRAYGFRVFLDDEWLLEQDWLRQLRRHSAVRQLAAGKHTLRVEYFRTEGTEAFDFTIRRISPPASSEGPLAGLGVWTDATFDLTGEGDYKVEEISGEVTVTRTAGKVPATLRVSGRDLHARPFAFTVRRTDDKAQGDELVRVWGTLAPGGLNVQPMRRNALGMRFSLIPAGEFLRGSPQWFIEQQSPQPSGHERRVEGPQHKVQISKPFGLGVHEVTVGEFRAFVRAAKFVTQAEREGPDVHSFIDGRWLLVKKGYSWRDPHNARSEDHPVVQVTANDAREFHEWLGKRDRVAYRLPTEAEWEYAARAGTSTTWPFGDDGDALGDYAWHRGNSGLTTQPVGRKKPNAWGLHDVLGNVNEWCGEFYDADYYAKKEGKDPRGPASSVPHAGWFVVRGGHVDGDAQDCRPGRRASEFLHRSQNLLGFRVACPGWTPSQLLRLKQARHLPAHEYQIFGAKGLPEAVVRSGDVSTTVFQDGPVATIRTVAISAKSSPYSLLLRAPGLPDRVVTDVLLRADWDVKFHATSRPAHRRAAVLAATLAGGPPNPLVALAMAHAASKAAEAAPVPAPPCEQQWQAAKPLLQGRVPSLDFDWGLDSPGPGVPCNHFGLVATTELDVGPEAAGEYRLAVVSGGARVYLDDVLILDAWKVGDGWLVSAVVPFAAGKRRLRVEYFHYDGEAVLRVRTTRLGPIR